MKKTFVAQLLKNVCRQQVKLVVKLSCHRGQRRRRKSLLELDVDDYHAFKAFRASQVDLVVDLSGLKPAQ